ncbi:MAG: outer membrane beta-barrel protein [Lentimicrobiaceae bacterium]|nr:outer membrane beta-barrel protein [Lentimicrobiaceae bacterium]
MKHLISIALLLALLWPLQAQVNVSSKSPSSAFGSGMDLFTDVWMNLPAGIEARTINQGMNFYTTYSNPIGKSPFALSVGLSLGAHNLYSNASLESDTSGSFFVKIPSTDLAGKGEKIEYKRNKLVLAYLELPLEIVLKTEKGLSASLGVKAGLLLNGHTKYKGDDPMGSGTAIKIKRGDLPNLESYRLSGIVRLGYKWVTLYGGYALTPAFKEGLGPDIYPVSVGISLRPN